EGAELGDAQLLVEEARPRMAAHPGETADGGGAVVVAHVVADGEGLAVAEQAPVEGQAAVEPEGGGVVDLLGVVAPPLLVEEEAGEVLAQPQAARGDPGDLAEVALRGALLDHRVDAVAGGGAALVLVRRAEELLVGARAAGQR